jgi:tRNA (guanine-N7-)-methyltransferase
MRDLSFYSDYYIDLSINHPPLNLETIFKNSNEVSLEIGFGEGDFLTELAKYNPNMNFVGLEIKKNRFTKALRQAYKLKLKNIKFIHMDASINLLQIFKENSFNKIYINFPDPWPKERHKKHRIINREFLNQIYGITKRNCYIEIASDHKEYIDLITGEFSNTGSYILKSKLVYFSSRSTLLKTTTKFEREFIDQRREIYYLSYIKYKNCNIGRI